MTAFSVMWRLLCSAVRSRNYDCEKAYLRALTRIMRRRGSRCDRHPFEDLFSTHVSLAADASLWRQTHFGIVLVTGALEWNSEQLANRLGFELRQIDFTQRLHPTELAIGLPLLSGADQLHEKARIIARALLSPHENTSRSSSLTISTAIHPLHGYSAEDLLQSARSRASCQDINAKEGPRLADLHLGTPVRRRMADLGLDIVPKSA